MPTNKNLSNLVINKVESQAVYDQMKAQNLINEDELYLINDTGSSGSGTVEYDGKQYTIIPDVDNPYFAFFGDSILNTSATRLRSDKYIAEFIPGTGAKFYDAETEKLLWTCSNNRLNDSSTIYSSTDRYFTNLYDYDDEIFTVQHYYPLKIQGGNRLYVYSPSTKKYTSIGVSDTSYNERGKVYYAGNDGTYAYFIMGSSTITLDKRALTNITTSVSKTNFRNTPIPQVFHKGKGYSLISEVIAGGNGIDMEVTLNIYNLSSGTSYYSNSIIVGSECCDTLTATTAPKILWIEDDENGDPVFYVAYSKMNTNSYDTLGKIYLDPNIYGGYAIMDITIPGLQGGLKFIAYQGHITDNTVLLTMEDAAGIPMVYKITMCTDPENAACGSYEIDGIANITVEAEKQIMLGKIYSKFYHKSKYMALNGKTYLINLDDMSTVEFKYKTSPSATSLTTAQVRQTHHGIAVGYTLYHYSLSNHEIMVYTESYNGSTYVTTQENCYGPFQQLSNYYDLVSLQEVEG